MKKKKTLSIVLIAAALFSAFSGYKINAGAPEIRNTIKNAVYVSDGRVIPENEGKIVIVPGTLDADLPYVDKETGITLNGIVAWRYVQKLRVGEDTESEEKYWNWDFEYSPDAFGGHKKLIAPNVTLGEFAVADEFMKTLAANQKRTEYTQKELNQMGWKVFTDQGRTYLYQGDRMPENETDVDEFNTHKDKYAYEAYIDTLRVGYDEKDDELDYTIVGLQQNGQLVEAPELASQFVCAGHLTVEEVLEYADSNAKSSSKTAYIIAAALLAIGVFSLVKKEKQAG